MTKSIFITGAASGIGLASARRFAGEGWFVGLSDVDEAGLERALAAIGPASGVSLPLDVRDRAACELALERFQAAAGGRLDALLNNAGIALYGAFDASDMEACDELIAINVNGVVNMAHAAIPYLKATPGSCLINIASSASIYGVPNLAVYSASKFAVRGLSEALDVELATHGVRVTCIMPGVIDTPLLDKAAKEPGRSFREAVSELDMDSADEAARVVHEAAHGDELHYTVGAQARDSFAGVLPNQREIRARYRGLAGQNSER